MKTTLTILITSLALTATAEVPKVLHYQGYLTDGAGEAVDCPDAVSCAQQYDITFRLHELSEGGQALWEETHVAVPITHGLIDVRLGEKTVMATAVLEGGELYLGMSINGDAELLPRPQLVSAAFAMRADVAGVAEDAATLGGTPAADYVTMAALETKGYCEAPCYGDADVEALLDDKGVAAFSGQYSDLEGTPDLSGFCALPCYGDAQVQAYLADQGYAPGASYTDGDVAAYLADNGFVPGAPYADAQVQALLDTLGYQPGPHYTNAKVQVYLDAAGYTSGPHFSGDYGAITGKPAVLGNLDLDAEGGLSFAGNTVINKSGTWAGPIAGLEGPAGSSCVIENNGDGTATISSPGSPAVKVQLAGAGGGNGGDAGGGSPWAVHVGDLYVNDDGDLDKLQALVEVTGKIIITNVTVTNLDLGNLKFCTRLQIYGSKFIETITGDALRSCEVGIYNNEKLKSVTLSNFKGSHFGIVNNEVLDSVSLPAASTLAIGAAGNPALTSLSLPGLKALTGLSLADNELLESVSMPELVHASGITLGRYYVTYQLTSPYDTKGPNPKLSSILAPKMETNTSFALREDGAAPDFSFVGMPATIGSLSIYENDTMQSLTGDWWNGIKSIKNMTIRDNPALTSLPAFSGLTEVGSILRVRDNAVLTTLQLDNLESIASTWDRPYSGPDHAAVIIRDNSLLETIGMPKLKTLVEATENKNLHYALWVSQNPVLAALLVPSLETSDHIRVEYNTLLSQLDASSLTCAHKFEAYKNPALPSCQVSGVCSQLTGPDCSNGCGNSSNCSGCPCN